MPTTKTGNKETPPTSEPRASADVDMRLAYEIHTLAQLVYSELVMSPRWPAGPSVPFNGTEYATSSPGAQSALGAASHPLGWPAPMKNSDPFWSVPSHWPV